MRTMKKALACLLVVAMFLTAAPLNGFVGLQWPDLDLPEINFSNVFNKNAEAASTVASGKCGEYSENLLWSLNSYGTLTISGKDTMKNYKSFTLLPWYDYISSIKKIIIEDGVTSIGDRAFFWCENVTDVTIPDSVTIIGTHAFSGCKKLTNITISADITIIGERAFSGCDKLTNITVASENENYCNDEYGVLFNKDMTTLIQYPIGHERATYEIPTSVTTIAKEAFSGCNNLSSITIPPNVQTIDYYAFNYCLDLESIIIQNPDCAIYDSAETFHSNITLYGNTGSTAELYAMKYSRSFVALDVDPPTTPKVIASGTCGENLTWTLDENGTLNISGTGVMTDFTAYTTMPWYSYREEIQNVIIDDGVTSIGCYAFYNFDSIVSITISDSVTSIGYGAFEYCDSITNITIPDSVTSIDKSAFSVCNSLISITFEKNSQLTNISEYAFAYCENLSNVSFGKNSQLKSIGSGVFYNCFKLTSVDFGENSQLKSIGASAFYDCNLTNITIPDSVTTIGGLAFNSCSSLTSIIIPDNVTTIGNMAFAFCHNLKNITVKAGNKSYRSDSYGVLFSYDMTQLKQYPIGNTRNSYNIPNEVTSIAASSFAACKNLERITIPNNVASIASGAFEYCENLTSIVIPNGVTSIPSSCFAECKNLKSVTIADSVTIIDGWAFENCTNLECVEFGEKSELTSIGAAAFDNCNSLVKITIPSNVTDIHMYAFDNCSSLCEITILNPDCEIFDAFSIYYSAVICGYNNSSAQEFAEQNNRAFVSLTGNATDIILSASCGNSAELTITRNGAMTVTGTGNMYNYYSSGLKPEWYNLRRFIKSITIADTITSIGSNTFYDFYQLFEIIIPDSVTSIGSSAFYACENLTSITIPDSVTSIDSLAFTHCNNLASITILNPACMIFNDANTIKSGATIYGYTGSTAEKYAEKYNRTFVALAAHEHSYTSTVTLAATCCTTGVMTYTCECDDSYTEVIPFDFNNHAGGTEIRDAVTPTCSIEGYTGDTYCLGCNNKIADGSPISMPAHHYESVIIAPTCEYGGHTTHTCTACGYNYTTDETDAIGHNYVGTVTLEPTCTDPGVKTYVCQNDAAHAYKEEIPAPGHTPDTDATCTNAQVCCVCGKELQPALGHTWDEGVLDPAPTPEQDGILTFTCNRCGETKTETVKYEPEIIASGTCGENLTWTLYADGKLVISGTGGMTNYSSYSSVPWYSNRSEIKKVVIKSGVTSIGNYAFANCTGLVSVDFGDNSQLQSIGAHAFYSCGNLVRITIPDNVTTIGNSAFQYCRTLASITLPDDLTSIGNSAFWNCVALTSITIPHDITNIGNAAFLGCYGLVHITVDEDNANYSSDEYGVLFNKDKTSLIQYPIGNARTEYKIPDSVTTIGEDAFADCGNLVKITIPSGVTSIGWDSFRESSSLANITVDESNSNYCSDDYGVLFNKSKTHLIQYPIGNTRTEYIIPDGVTSIAYYAFKSCKNLESIIIPDGVTNITDGMFVWCDKLANITIPASVTRIGMQAYAFCDSLTDIIILNPDCKIYDSSSTFDSIATIYGYTGSTAEAYATKYNRTFVALEAHEHSYTSEVTLAATCCTTGVKTYTCECEDSYTEVIPFDMNNHTGGTKIRDAVKFNCITGGYSGDTYCLGCGNKIADGIRTPGTGEHTYEYKTMTEIIEIKGNNKIDLVFVVDTTGSMSGYIAAMQNGMKGYLNQLEAKDIDYRIAIVDYRDFPERASANDYPYKVQLTFTGNEDSVIAAINALSLGGGGDEEETVYSALIDGLNDLTWREDAGKTVILMGDADSLDPEPNTGYTLADAVESLQKDYSSPVTLFAISATGSTISTFASLATQTGGKCYTSAAALDVSEFVSDIIETIEKTVIIPDSEWVFVKAPTCTEPGEESRTCTVCGDVQTRTTPAPGHVPGSEADCTKDCICTVCGEILVPAYGHSVVLKEKKPAHCEFSGHELYYCENKNCDYEYKIIIPPTGHSYEAEVIREATCALNGLIRHTCTICCEYYDIITYAEHSFEQTEYIPATCTVDGRIVYTCQNCPEQYTETITAGHQYVSAVTKEPTYTEPGTLTYTCTVCGHSYSQQIPMLSNKTVLLVQDNQPWQRNDAVNLLNDMIARDLIDDWSIVNSADLTASVLADYDVVYIVNDQSDSTYNKLSGHNEILTAYANNGGVVIYGACDEAWECGTINYTLPGGVTKGNYYSLHNYIVDTDHPIVIAAATDGAGITNSNLYGTYCSHTWFDASTLPANSNIILQDKNARPTLVEFEAGNGMIILSGLTWEFYYSRVRPDTGSSVTYSTRVFDDLIMYALAQGNRCAHEFLEGNTVGHTCTEYGYTEYTCTKCGYVEKRNLIAPQHSFGEYAVVDPGSCERAKTEERVCAVCGEAERRITKPLGHSFVAVVTKEATCTEHGIITNTCKLCGHSYETTTYADHNYVLSEHTAATCTQDGRIVYTCTGCKDSYTEPIPASHDYVRTVTKQPTETEEGIVTYTCSKCGDTYEERLPKQKTANILLVQDTLPWTIDSNAQLFNNLVSANQISGWKVISSSALKTANLSSYDVIFIAGDQRTETYNNINACHDILQSFAQQGGVVIYNACDNGWQGGEIRFALPDGVQKIEAIERRNYIVNGSHPIVCGIYTDGKELTDYLLNGTYCSHSSFNKNTLPAGYSVILQDRNANPTLVEYSVGNGRFILSGLTWEFYYSRLFAGIEGDTTYSKNVFDDLIVYAVSCCQPCEHDYAVVRIAEATCTQEGYTVYACATCGRTYTADITAMLPHTIVAVDAIAATCTTQGMQAHYKCTVCDTLFLDADATQKTTADSLVIAKSDHTWNGGVIITEPGCETSGIMSYTCEFCGTENKKTIAPTGHAFTFTAESDATCTESGYVLYTCARCKLEKREVIAPYGHDFGSDNICDRCGFEVPPEHEHSFAKTVVDATCTTPGYTEYVCDCGYSYRADIIEQLGHDWDKGVVTLAKTCTTDGTLTKTCTVCSATRVDPILASHEWSESIIKKATCTEDGEKSCTCTVCGETKTEVIPAGHTWSVYTITKEATCTEPGKETRVCSVCGISQEFDIPVLGHHFVDGICTRCGIKFIDIITKDYANPDYGMYFAIDEIVSDYGPSLVDEYGVLLDYNEEAQFDKVAIYLTQDGTMWRRCIACTGSNITRATFVPYLAYNSEVLYSGLNSAYINTFRLSKNASGIWVYNNYATIGANLEDAYGNLLLSLYDIGQAGAKTRIFDDLDEMKAWLQEDCENHTEEVLPGVEPTCTEFGKTEGKWCPNCEQIIVKQEILAKVNHSGGTATCISKANCVHCGAEYGERGDHIKGSYTEPASCTVNGYTMVFCTECGEELDFEVIPATHKPGADATCTTAQTCTVCGETLAPATGHTPGDAPTCTTSQICTVCGETLAPALGHSAHEDVPCTEDLYCITCGDLLRAATDHQFETTLVTPPGCMTHGIQIYTCTVCGETMTLHIGPIGHTWGDWIVESEATFETEGLKKRICSVCADEETEIIPVLETKEFEDKDSGVSVETDKNAYGGKDVEVKVEEVFDGSHYLTQSFGKVQTWNIKTYVDGEKAQPDTPVYVRIPLPEGFDPNKTFVYHINSQTGEREKMDVQVIDGYICFYTSSFSLYIVVDESTLIENPTELIIIKPYTIAKESADGFAVVSVNTSVAELLAASNATAVLTATGEKVAETAKLATGMVLALMDGETVVDSMEIVVLGDVNGDSKITAADARVALRISVELESPAALYLTAAGVNGNKTISSSDARCILRAAVELDDPASWLANF